MPTKTEREYYRMGFLDGMSIETVSQKRKSEIYEGAPYGYRVDTGEPRTRFIDRKPKRKLSAWNKFVKANSKKPRFRLRSGSPNLKKLAVAFRKTPAGKKSKRR